MHTEIYLDALRKGDYLQALQWLEFLVTHYSVPEGDADTILQLAIFELIHHGFTPDDFCHIEILYMLLYDQLPPFVERVSYNATVLCNAAMQYMVLHEHELLEFYKTEESLHAKAIHKWMKRSPPELPPEKNNDELMKKYTALNKSSLKFQKQAQMIRDKVNYIIDCQVLLKEYCEELAKYQDKEDFAAVRLGVIKSLYDYLMKQTITSPEVLATVTDFVNTIEKMKPYPWEVTVLSKLSVKNPKPFISWFFDKSAEQFQFFAVKVIGTILPSVPATEDSVRQEPK
ncbi:helical bundle domain-containing protein [Legionella cardiaca]|uniref:Helical bundle domain-containing protein n=1 Tax=Legionella cardiaca TaxID=1071983 RepID=A0ABY8APA1_9GAMM|nr:helical bundle domain-containing protein [Legionella cardiaca]WED42530.1 helical bundle domain-containing protein [Legionella cardiaca]